MLWAGVVGLVAATTAWPAWRATRDSPAQLMRRGDVRRPQRRAGATGGLAVLGARLIMAHRARFAALVAAWAAAVAVVLLLLALASLLTTLRDDPATLEALSGHHGSGRQSRGGRRGDSGRAGRGASLRGRRRQRHGARLAASADRLPGRPQSVRGACLWLTAGAFGRPARPRLEWGWQTRSVCGWARHSRCNRKRHASCASGWSASCGRCRTRVVWDTSGPSASPRRCRSSRGPLAVRLEPGADREAITPGPAGARR